MNEAVENTPVDQAVSRLLGIAERRGVQVSEYDQALIRLDVERKFAFKWTLDEIVLHMRNMEEINPEISEECALANMRYVAGCVAARLSRAVG